MVQGKCYETKEQALLFAVTAIHVHYKGFIANPVPSGHSCPEEAKSARLCTKSPAHGHQRPLKI